MQSYFFTNKPSLVLASLISLITLTGCGGGSSNTSTTPQLKGIWERVGYGDIIKIEENGGAVYQYTRATCLMSEALDGDEINEYLSDAEVTQQKLTIKNNYSFPVQYQKRAALPETCSDDALITSATPTESFEHLWHTFNDYYAFLNERNVDWENSYLAFKPMISDEMADEELFSVFANMLSVIDDGHVELESSENDYSPESIKGANRVVLEGFANQSEYDDIQEFASAYSNQYEQNLRSYLDEESIESYDGFYPERMLWGTIDQRIGYLRIASMGFFQTGDEEQDLDSNLDIIHSLMSQVLSDLEGTEAVIIDVRFNDGGSDEISLAIASYFADQPRKVASKYARYWQGNTQTVDVSLEPISDSSYISPVIVIGGEDSVSATEVFLMTMKAIPHATLIGENSSGAVSDSLDKKLPNGWSFSLSNEVYSDILGNQPEVTGVIPDMFVPVFSLESIATGQNAAIDFALDLLDH